MGPGEETTERPMSPLAAALWTVGLTLLAQVCVGVTEAARPGADGDIVNLTACEILATSIVVFAMVRVHARDASLRQMLGLRPMAALHLPLAIAAGAGLCPLLSTVDAMILRRWPLDDPQAVENLHKIVSSSPPPVFVVSALVVMPLAHELFFRGIVYGGIERAINARVALLATAVFYSCSYLQWQDMPTAFALGVALAWLRERTGTVLAPIVAQLALGAVDGIPILRGRDPMADVAYPPKWIAGGAVIALLALLAVGAGRRDS